MKREVEPMEMKEKLCISVNEMAKLMSIGVNKAYELTHIHDFPKLNLDNGRIIINRKALERWIETNTNGVKEFVESRNEG